MEPRVRLAAVGLSQLEASGLRSVARGLGMMGVERYADFAAFAPEADSYDLYAATAEEFASNPDFFMPKRHRTVVVSHRMRPGEENQGGGMAIYSDSDETEVAATLEKLLHTLDDSRRGQTGTLSQREMEVLRHIASGLTNKEIGDALCISANTVITHRKNISAKLGIRSVSGLSLYAMMNGLV